jgi:multidrug resistance efflux pump
MFLQQYERRSKLTNLSISAEGVDNARWPAESAAASHQQAIASSELASLNLKRTEVRAAVNGFVSELNLGKGDYASPAKPVLAVIDCDSYRVDAYFEETKIPQISVGSPVDIHLTNGAAVSRGSV